MRPLNKAHFAFQKPMSTAVAIYCDGGVGAGIEPGIGSRSQIGGTYAWCIVDAAIEERRHDATLCPDLKTKIRLFDPIAASTEYVAWGCGYLTCQDLDTDSVTNNVTELCAILIGCSMLGPNFKGMLYSDSSVSLQRALFDAKLQGVPEQLVKCLVDFKAGPRKRLRNNGWNLNGPDGLLDGHPTDTDLALKKGKRGYPVSVHNRWCDYMCNIRKPDLAEYARTL